MNTLTKTNIHHARNNKCLRRVLGVKQEAVAFDVNVSQQKQIKMNRFILLFFILCLTTTGWAQNKSFHDFTVKDITGKDISLSAFKGKKILVVNVASKCGLTPQYQQLQELYETYGPDKFVILGFPANNFKQQEPGTNEEIQEFCTINYGVTFPLMEKISVKGEDMHPVYKWLTQKSENGKQDAEVTWNFQKFMIDENGNWEGYAEPKTLPDDEKIIGWIEEQKTPRLYPTGNLQ